MAGTLITPKAAAPGRVAALRPRAAGLPWSAFGVGVAVIGALSLPIAFFAMFSGFRDYDDEGYLLLSLRQYAQGGVLYDQLYSQYGPAYFQLLRGLFAILGLEFTHTAGRGVVIGVWILTAALCSLTAYRLTGSGSVAISCQLLVFYTLRVLRDEPPHPGGLLALILSGVVLAGSCLGRWPRRAAAVIGALLAIALLMKINVGLLAALGVVFALVAVVPRAEGGWALKPAVAVLMLAPLALATLLVPSWRVLFFVTACSALAVVVTQLGSPARKAGAARELRTLLTAATVTGVVSCGWEVVRGTSARGLLQGIILDPVRFPTLFPISLNLAPVAALWAVVCLAGALAVLVARRRGWADARAATALHGPARLLTGVLIWLVAAGYLALSPLAVSLPLLWVGLTAPADPNRQMGTSLLVAVAVLQALHAYPIPGSQIAFATFLFIPVGAVTITDGWRETVATLGQPNHLDAPRLGAAVVVAVGMVALAARPVIEDAYRVRVAYHAGVPLDLPGAERIRVTPYQASLYRQLTASLSAHCQTFVTMPGLNSLYLFSRLEPPTMMNATAWRRLLTSGQQTAIAERLSRMTVPVCAIRQRGAWWRPPPTPLERYISEAFVPFAAIGPYDFMIRRGPESDREASR